MFLSTRNRSNTQLTPIVRGLTIGILMVAFQLLSGCVSVYDLASRSLLPNEGVRVSSYSVRTKRLVGFTTSDGVRLVSDIHFPKKNGKTPTILVIRIVEEIRGIDNPYTPDSPPSLQVPGYLGTWVPGFRFWFWCYLFPWTNGVLHDYTPCC